MYFDDTRQWIQKVRKPNLIDMKRFLRLEPDRRAVRRSGGTKTHEKRHAQNLLEQMST
jgi:hypothetical protein